MSAQSFLIITIEKNGQLCLVHIDKSKSNKGGYKGLQEAYLHKDTDKTMQIPEQYS